MRVGIRDEASVWLVENGETLRRLDGWTDASLEVWMDVRMTGSWIAG